MLVDISYTWFLFLFSFFIWCFGRPWLSLNHIRLQLIQVILCELAWRIKFSLATNTCVLMRSCCSTSCLCFIKEVREAFICLFIFRANCIDIPLQFLEIAHNFPSLHYSNSSYRGARCNVFLGYRGVLV